MADVIQKRRRWFRFSLRTLLVAWLLLAAWLAWWINSSKQQQNAVEQIRQLAEDPGIYYGYQLLPTINRLPTRIVGDDSKASYLPGFLIDRLGVDYFHNVESIIILRSRRGGDIELTTQLAKLPRLRHLAMIYANPTDAAVKHLGKLQQLRSLELNSASLTDASLKFVAGLPNLQALDLAGDFTDAGLQELQRLNNLRSLKIASPRMTDAGIANLGEIVTLKQLEIKNRQITDESFRHLAKLANLEDLYLATPKITGKGSGQLSKCTHLASIIFYHTAINDENLIDLAAVASLQSLNLTGSKQISGRGVQHLAPLKNLRSLKLAASDANDEVIPFLAQMPALEQVELSYTNVTGKGLEGLAAAPRLRELVVPEKSSSFFGIGSSAGVDARQLARLQQLLPACKVSF